MVVQHVHCFRKRVREMARRGRRWSISVRSSEVVGIIWFSGFGVLGFCSISCGLLQGFLCIYVLKTPSMHHQLYTYILPVRYVKVY